jgi:hypothetical protein
LLAIQHTLVFSKAQPKAQPLGSQFLAHREQKDHSPERLNALHSLHFPAGCQLMPVVLRWLLELFTGENQKSAQ